MEQEVNQILKDDLREIIQLSLEPIRLELKNMNDKLDRENEKLESRIKRCEDDINCLNTKPEIVNVKNELIKSCIQWAVPIVLVAIVLLFKGNVILKLLGAE